MNLKDKIQAEIKTALKNGQSNKLTTLRFLLSQIKDKEIEKRHQLISDQEIIHLIKNLIKKNKENLPFFEKEKRADLIKSASEEIEILSTFTPQQVSSQNLEQEIEKIIRENPQTTNVGALIGLCVKKLAGQGDNQQIAEIVKKIHG